MAQQGGSGQTGQSTIGDESRKLTKGEAGFREDQGISNLRCGDCAFFENGSCQIVEGEIGEDDVCDEFEPSTKTGHMTADEATELRGRPLSTLEMWITRVSQDEKTGKRRWYSTSSGTKVDLYNERMSTELFDDFVERIDAGEQAPPPFISDTWAGGFPYLGVAHYLDLDGYGIVGPTERVWRDGNTLKMQGTFDDNPLAQAAYEAIRRDRLENRADDERVRVSIAFVDWGHNHGEKRTFVRKSLADACMLCEAGVGNKVYTSGQLVHLALTRRPAYPETEIVALEERAMSKRRDDAASIVGDELADELEKRQHELVGRAGDGKGKVAAGAVVIKDESAGEDEAEAKVERALGGAKTLDEAEAYLTKAAEGSPPLLDSWGVLEAVIVNIAGEESREPIHSVLRDFQGTLDVQAAEALLSIHRVIEAEASENGDGAEVERQVPPQFRKDEEQDQKRKRRPDEESSDESDGEMSGEEEAPSDGEAASEDQPESEEEDMDKKKQKDMEEKSVHPLDAVLAAVRTSFDEALATPGDPEMRLQMIQESVTGLGTTIQNQVMAAQANAPVDAATIQRAVADAVAPLQAALNALQAQVKSGLTVEKSASSIPGRRAIKMPVASVPVAPVIRSEADAPASDENPTPRLRSLIRKSTVGYERARGR